MVLNCPWTNMRAVITAANTARATIMTTHDQPPEPLLFLPSLILELVLPDRHARAVPPVDEDEHEKEGAQAYDDEAVLHQDVQLGDDGVERPDVCGVVADHVRVGRRYGPRRDAPHRHQQLVSQPREEANEGHEDRRYDELGRVLSRRRPAPRSPTSCQSSS